MRWFVLLVLVGCGHTMKVGAGPLVDSRGKPGVETSLELGTHLIGAKEAAMPIGVRLEASATADGMQGLIGLAFGVTLPPGGRRTVEDSAARDGWGGRLSLASGAAFDQHGVAFVPRGGLAVTRGALARGGRTGGGCSSGGEKTRFCYSWNRWSYSHTGIEVATALRFVGDGEKDGKLHLDGWRVAAEVIYERGTLRDFELH